MTLLIQSQLASEMGCLDAPRFCAARQNDEQFLCALLRHAIPKDAASIMNFKDNLAVCLLDQIDKVCPAQCTPRSRMELRVVLTVDFESDPAR